MAKVTKLENFIMKKEAELKNLELTAEDEAVFDKNTKKDIELMKELGIYPSFDEKAAVKGKLNIKDENKLLDRYNSNEADKMDDFFEKASTIVDDAKSIGLFAGMKFNN